MGKLRDAYNDGKARAQTGEPRKPAPQQATGKMSGAQNYFTPPLIPQPTWEYALVQYLKSLQRLNEIASEVNRMGEYGWELCERRENGTGTIRGDQFFTLIFKRRTS